MFWGSTCFVGLLLLLGVVVELSAFEIPVFFLLLIFLCPSGFGGLVVSMLVSGT
jgi:hypothetical protein